MQKTEFKSMRLTVETVKQAAELGRLWCPIAPLNFPSVVAECIKRAYALELSTRKEKAG